MPDPITPPGLGMPDSVRRALRTLMWCIAAAVPVIPTLAASFSLSAVTVGKITSIFTVATVVITVLVNGAEDRNLIPAFFKAPASEGANPIPDPDPDSEPVAKVKKAVKKVTKKKPQ